MSVVDQLYQLQQTDTALEAAKQRLGAILRAQEEPEELKTARVRAEKATAVWQRWRTTQKDEELELGSTNSKADRSSDRLYSGKVRNPKELEDLQKEIEALGRRRAALEDELLETMLMLEESEAEREEAAAVLAKMTAAWEEKTAALREEQHTVALQINALIAQRQQRAARVEAAALRQYDSLRQKKGGLAVANLKNGSCQGCRVGLPASKVLAVKEGGLETCSSCGRILYGA